MAAERAPEVIGPVLNGTVDQPGPGAAHGTERGINWDRHGEAAPPPLPDDVIAATLARYVEVYERLTGLRWG